MTRLWSCRLRPQNRSNRRADGRDDGGAAVFRRGGDGLVLFRRDAAGGGRNDRRLPGRTFRPKNTVTTGQALKMILLAAGYPEPERAASHWARGYLDFAIEQGFVTRFKEITDLDVPISRALVAQIAAKAMGLTRPEAVEVSFTDTDDDNVLALAAIGIVDGYKDGTFLPSKSLTRAELAAITARITNYLAPATPDSGDTDLDDNTPIMLRTTESGVALHQGARGLPRDGLLGLFAVFHRLRLALRGE